jgi:hypothetical protein
MNPSAPAMISPEKFRFIHGKTRKDQAGAWRSQGMPSPAALTKCHCPLTRSAAGP